MDREQQAKIYRRAVGLTRRGDLPDAALLFRQLVDAGSMDPLHLSYCALMTATVHHDRRAGTKMMRKAISLGAQEPQVMLNAARLYETLGERHKAVKILRQGLRETPKHPELLRVINRLAPRRPPAISLLDRDNPLNKTLGKATARIEGKKAASGSRKGR